jgi:hypothetical protein
VVIDKPVKVVVFTIELNQFGFKVLADSREQATQIV